MTTSNKPRRMARQPITVEGEGTAVATEGIVPATTPPTAQHPTKQALVLGLLRSDGGASLKTILAATGWQAHTARSALSGLRRKGHAIARSTVDGETRYALRDGSAQ